MVFKINKGVLKLKLCTEELPLRDLKILVVTVTVMNIVAVVAAD
jgi:hypothetical protein